MTAPARPSGSDPCPVCASRESRPFLEAAGYRLSRCSNCTHGFVEDMPSAEDLARLYSETDEDDFLANVFAGAVADYFDSRMGAAEGYYADRIRSLRSLGLEPDAPILDFGCAMGGFLYALRKIGFTQTTGFELAAALVERGRTRWGLDLHTGDAEAFFEKRQQHFAAICSFFVLEHVRSPRQTLELLRSGLRPGGLLVVSVPNASSLQVRLTGKRSPVVDPPHHLQYFSPASTRRMVEESGFEILSERTLFWSGESDFYLREKGVPLWIARGLRSLMAIPGVPINLLGLGGVATVTARLRT